MITRVLIFALAGTWLFGAAIVEATPPWDPSKATADAERDITARHIRFAYVGGRASYAPGLPEDGRTWLFVLHRYSHLEVGPQGCDQDDHFSQRKEYARRYNQRMWSYVSKHR
jgi:hypothetical protein